jgi:enterochelin esterase-like enzyme
MIRDHNLPRGRLETVTVESAAIKANLLGDPADRAVPVYLPHGHDGAGLPLLVDLVGYTGSGLGHVNWKNFGENVPERLDRLIAEEAMPPVAVAFPDCFTRLGGNQYINSPVMGAWADFLIAEMLPAVEGRFACGGPGKRGLFGKSSGGYGAMVHGLLHGGSVWSAAACHSGDMGHELLFLPDFASVLRALDKKGGTVEGFIEAFEADPKPSGDAIHALMFLAMAATYDPDPAAPYGIRLPVTQDTCEIIPERWANWMAWDPLTLVEEPANQDRLRALKALFIDCGTRDQYNLLYGARRMHRRLEALGIAHDYQEFDDTHSGIDYRMDESLPVLAKALSD